MTPRYLTAAIAAMLSPCVFAITPFVVKDIRVEGVQRTEVGTVFNYLPIKIGDTVNDDRISQAIRSLFATGFFKDVRIESDRDVLVVSVEEQPAIAQISFSGNKEFDTDVLTKGLKEAGIAESRTFDRSTLEKAEQEIKRLYLTKSYYGVKVRTTTSPLPRNRVAINFEITEGEVAKIKKITVIGTKAFKDTDIVDLLSLNTTGFWSFITKNDLYSRVKLQGDLETIKSYYLDHGYLDFNLDATQVSITPDKRDVYITISLHEGEQYKVSSVKFAGDLLLPESQLRPLAKLKPGDIYSRELQNATSKAIADRLGNDGYAFANVNVAPEIDQDKRQVALTFFVDPGRRVYVDRINVSGNAKTRDEVVRREMRQMEGAWFDRESVEKSKLRLDRSGFFDEVTINPVPKQGEPDKVNLDVAVKEHPTGALSVGVGYSQTDKLVLSGSISQNNLFGTGNALSLAVNTGKTSRLLSLSYTNPYYTPDGVSRSFELYHRTTDTSSLSVSPYKSRSTGGGVTYGFPVSDEDNINVGLSAEHTALTLFENSPVQYQTFVSQYGYNTVSVPATVAWVHEGRNSSVYPTDGTYQRAASEVSLPVGDLRYWRLTYQWQRYFPLSSTYTLMLNSDLGYAKGYGGKSLPFLRNFYAGGIGSVRGYTDSSLGPKVTDSSGTTSSLGGNRRIVGNMELLFPVPGSKEKDRSLRLSLFVDGGQVWGSDQTIKMADVRFSSGVALSWVSPIGPMRFSFGIPLNKKEGDSTQKLQFQLGTVF